MNNISKKFMTLGLIFFTSLSFSQTPKKLWTLKEVKEIAKKYGMEDYVSETKNTALLYDKKEDIERYFQLESQTLKATKEFKECSEKTMYVRTYDDYLKLIEQYPTVKAQVEKTHGGKESFVKYNELAKKEKWRIYRNASGGLSFQNAALPIEPQELQWGKRVDNLPKSANH
jgi:hypothetical protein